MALVNFIENNGSKVPTNSSSSTGWMEQNGLGEEEEVCWRNVLNVYSDDCKIVRSNDDDINDNDSNIIIEIYDNSNRAVIITMTGTTTTLTMIPYLMCMCRC